MHCLNLNVKRSDIPQGLSLGLAIAIIRTILKNRLSCGPIRRALSHLIALVGANVPSIAVITSAHFIDIIIGAKIKQG